MLLPFDYLPEDFYDDFLLRSFQKEKTIWFFDKKKCRCFFHLFVKRQFFIVVVVLFDVFLLFLLRFSFRFVFIRIVEHFDRHWNLKMFEITTSFLFVSSSKRTKRRINDQRSTNSSRSLIIGEFSSLNRFDRNKRRTFLPLFHALRFALISFRSN